METWQIISRYAYGVRSLLCKVVVVSIDSTAEFACLNEALPHDLIVRVGRQVKLEEASMRDGEAVWVQVVKETDFMASRQTRQVDRQTVATPDELEIVAALRMRH